MLPNKMPPSLPKSQKGNALFLILIAVALFAALSYAITQSNRGGGGLSRENTQILEAKINDFFSDVQRGTLSIRVINNCPVVLPGGWTIYDINSLYTTSNFTPGYPNIFKISTLTAERKACDLWASEGGGLTTYGWLYDAVSGNYTGLNFGLSTGAADALFTSSIWPVAGFDPYSTLSGLEFYANPASLTPELFAACRSINSKNGLPAPNDAGWSDYSDTGLWAVHGHKQVVMCSSDFQFYALFYIFNILNAPS